MNGREPLRVQLAFLETREYGRIFALLSKGYWFRFLNWQTSQAGNATSQELEDYSSLVDIYSPGGRE